ncbi:trans-aconitate 2-methyltransferase [Luteimicrobium album]|uniref:Trans-aconitate 2-methyltransferase n=1 Tax=Luteimicrobium album TaxID=1054550 RepID=A0ABQ6I2T6_9MICO|nr:methyltransferase domain-containing protein [Luteimicrobium album]GMA24094.1 trans-aconitate 2-methyltransferase [Luteimicrobium album]
MTARPSDWDPRHYLRFSDERSRPFVDLLARVPGTPRTVLDLGVGPGHLVAAIHARWPDAVVTGVDSSPAMVEQARAEHGDEAEFVLGDLADYAPDAAPDLVVSNAALQWVPGHLDVLARWRDLLGRGPGARTLAVQVPANQDAPSHAILNELAATEPYARWTQGTARVHVHRAEEYLEVLAQPGWTVDAWETTYLHVLQGPDAVFTWISATGARPVLAALPDDVRPAFVEEYKARLRAAYPERAYGTVLPFRRTFVVATRD